MNDFKAEYAFFETQIMREIERVLKSGWYILGQEVKSFEEKFASYLGAKYCIGVANGLEALQISLMALDIGKGDEVITVSNSAVATALAISNLGAKIVFVDVDNYQHLDVTKIEQAITKKTKAIIPVHLFGQSVDIKQIVKVAQKYQLAVIEDACQAHGAEIEGKKVGTFGVFGCFSFYPTKNLGGYGDGGALVTDSKELYEKCKMLRNYGQKTRYVHQIQGINSRLDEIQAAILNVKLKKLEFVINKRNKIAQLYLKELAGVKRIKLPEIRKNSRHAFHLFVIETEKRDQLQQFLIDKGIECLIHYPIPIHKQDCYQEYNSLYLPHTETLAESILSLPIHPFMSQKDVKKVCSSIKEFFSDEK